jgi:hypothetical protein
MWTITWNSIFVLRTQQYFSVVQLEDDSLIRETSDDPIVSGFADKVLRLKGSDQPKNGGLDYLTASHGSAAPCPANTPGTQEYWQKQYQRVAIDMFKYRRRTLSV